MNAPDAPPAFLTTREVAALLRVRERKIYDLAAAGELPCRRVTGKLLFPRAEIEALLQGEAAPAQAPPVIAGSHDPLLDWAIREVGAGLSTAFDGSLDGLDRVAAGQACAAGLHVWDADTGAWNLPALRERLGSAPVVALSWAVRRRGLILHPRAAGVTDVAGLAGRRLARRQPAAGAAIWLEHRLAQAGVVVTWTDAVARTETDAAAAVAQGEADAAAGLEATARQFGLAFAPLVDEPFDLAIDRRAYFEPPMQALLAFARSPAFAAKAAALGGYAVTDLGAVRWNGA